MPATEKPTCGEWMPRKQEHCARKPGHVGDCRTAAAMADDRERMTGRRRGATIRYDPAARARWNRTSKYSRFGITEERFNQMLEEQDHACAICREPFEDQAPCIDHDHACCPGNRRACGKCVRGLLCTRCNIWLGWLEKHDGAARAYLARAAG